MYICYLDGSTKSDGTVVVAGVLCKLNEKYQRIQEVIYCFKNVFVVPYGYSIHEELALTNAIIEVNQCIPNLKTDGIVFINDSMIINKKIEADKTLCNKIDFMNILIDNVSNAEKRRGINQLVNRDWLNKIIKDLGIENLIIEKTSFKYAARSNVGISIANKLNKEISGFVDDKAKDYLKASLKKLASRNYLYDEKLKE